MGPHRERPTPRVALPSPAWHSGRGRYASSIPTTYPMLRPCSSRGVKSRKLRARFWKPAAAAGNRFGSSFSRARDPNSGLPCGSSRKPSRHHRSSPRRPPPKLLWTCRLRHLWRHQLRRAWNRRLRRRWKLQLRRRWKRRLKRRWKLQLRLRRRHLWKPPLRRQWKLQLRRRWRLRRRHLWKPPLRRQRKLPLGHRRKLRERSRRPSSPRPPGPSQSSLHRPRDQRRRFDQRSLNNHRARSDRLERSMPSHRCRPSRVHRRQWRFRQLRNPSLPRLSSRPQRNPNLSPPESRPEKQSSHLRIPERCRVFSRVFSQRRRKVQSLPTGRGPVWSANLESGVSLRRSSHRQHLVTGAHWTPSSAPSPRWRSWLGTSGPVCAILRGRCSVTPKTPR